MSPRKARLLIDVVRGMKVGEALTQLQFSKKHAARPIVKLIESAIANARQNHGMDVATLVIKEAYVNGGPMQYRWMPKAFGSATPIRRRTSHITVVLQGEAPTAVGKEAKENEKEEVKAAAEKPVKKSAPAKKAKAKMPSKS